jgi:hypothetical protein
MNHSLRSIFLILILMLSVLFMPAVMGAGIIELPEEDDLNDTDEDDFSETGGLPLAWIRIPVHQMAVLLKLGLSIFALCVVYLGGRSKHKRFNDRTLDHINAFISYSLKTALFVRAVFYFLFSVHLPSCSRKIPSTFFFPPLFSIQGGTKLCVQL